MRGVSRPWRSFVLASAMLAALCAAPPASAQLGGDGDFTRAETRKLDHGGIVMRRLTKQRGQLRLIGGTSWQVVDLPPEAVWRALKDVPRYHEMLPRVKRASVVEEHGDIKTVHIEHRHAAGVDYHVNIRFRDSKKEAFFQLDESRPGNLDAAWGFLRINERDDGKTLLSWGVMADMGSGIVSGMLRPVVHRWLLKVPHTIKKWVEGSGKSRYVD